MGDWNLLGGILEDVHAHSTMVGKIWLTILFIFRMLVLGIAAEDVWEDEQSEFVCNTEQPGCRNVCYDGAFPISLIRYWVLQIVFVSSPSLAYMGHALYRLRTLEKERYRKRALLKVELECACVGAPDEQRRLEKELKTLEQKKVRRAPLRGALLRTYVFHILTRSMVEVSFIVGQCALYGVGLAPIYKCKKDPCPNIVDCFVSRPTEKSVFMTFMLVIAGISLFLNILEILHLGMKKIKQGIYGSQHSGYDDCIYRSKKNSMVQQTCAFTNSSPQKLMHVTQTFYTMVPNKKVEALPLYIPANAPPPIFEARNRDVPLGLEHHSGQLHLSSQPEIQVLHQEQAAELSYKMENRGPSYNSDNSKPKGSGALRNLQSSSMENLPCLRPASRKHSRVSRHMDLSEESDVLDTDHCSHTRKASFLSRGMSESGLASPSDESMSGSESGIKQLSRGESLSVTPPFASGRRMSMSMILELSCIMKK
ncbi:connexin 52.6 [Electrophorus electricus]|uniref:Gap junction protein n=1 Tax=Electrophorus electricus TaxID=8005 RepID=A0AAY5EXX1_ELEEL|nr:connexin 52.6 [Electrophorus electricus]